MEKYYNNYLIGTVSKIFSISPGLIRHYEKIGLINSKKNSGNKRLYDLRLLEQIYSILLFRSLEVSLPDILKIKESITNDMNEVEVVLESQIVLVEERLAHLLRISQKTKDLLKEFKQLKKSLNIISVVDSPEYLFTNPSNTLDSEELARALYALTDLSSGFPKTSFILDKERIMQKDYTLDTYVNFGICIEYSHNSFNKTIPADSIIIQSKKCLYTVLWGLDFPALEKKYNEMMDWISKNNYFLSDNPFEMSNLCFGGTLLIEIYMPIEPIN